MFESIHHMDNIHRPTMYIDRQKLTDASQGCFSDEAVRTHPEILYNLTDRVNDLLWLSHPRGVLVPNCSLFKERVCFRGLREPEPTPPRTQVLPKRAKPYYPANEWCQGGGPSFSMFFSARMSRIWLIHPVSMV